MPTNPIPMPQSPVIDLETGYPTIPWYQFWNQPTLQDVDYPGKIATTDDLPEGKVNLYFTNARALAALAGGFQSSQNITIAYANGYFTANLTPVTVGVGGSLMQYGFDTYGRLSLSNPATTTNLNEGTNLYFTKARALAILDLATSWCYQ